MPAEYHALHSQSQEHRASQMTVMDPDSDQQSTMARVRLLVYHYSAYHDRLVL